MRISGLFGMAIALSALTPIAPAHAITISPGQLMETDLFLWPNWRQIVAEYDCTTELNFYLWNKPTPGPGHPRAPAHIQSRGHRSPERDDASALIPASSLDTERPRQSADTPRPSERVTRRPRPARRRPPRRRADSPGTLDLGHAARRLRWPRLRRFSAQKGEYVGKTIARSCLSSDSAAPSSHRRPRSAQLTQIERPGLANKIMAEGMVVGLR